MPKNEPQDYPEVHNCLGEQPEADAAVKKIYGLRGGKLKGLHGEKAGGSPEDETCSH